MAWRSAIRGVLLDVDGTLMWGEAAVPGAAATLDHLDATGLAWCLTTNTTRRPMSAVAEALRAAGMQVPVDRILAPAVLARRRVLDSGRRRAMLLVPEATRVDLAGVEPVEDAPDWVIVGDLGRDFTWERLNDAFRALVGGARLLALHKNPSWHAGEPGWMLDAGAFVAGLEFSADVRAEVLGKPSPAFFEQALHRLGLPAASVLVVGDDPINDGQGAAASGCRTALVRTGKLSDTMRPGTGFTPDLLLDSVADLPRELP